MTQPHEPESNLRRLRRLVIGDPRNVTDPHVFHSVSLVAFLAWIGLGADGLSSSAYGPEEAYKALGSHNHLAILLVAMSTVTIAVISIAYSNLITCFPGGGGGYLVATKLLGSRVGAISGCALLVDYVLTITVSIASGCDQFFSFLPIRYIHYKLPAEIVILALLVILNLRGVKESVNILAPIFILFIVTHAFLILYAIGIHIGRLPAVFHDAGRDFHSTASAIGLWPLILILLRAYSLGGGTYTGIEAVSNGVTILREPRVKTGHRTMTLMAVSLAFTAGGILFAYLLTGVHPAPGKTMNAVLLGTVFGSWKIGNWSVGSTLVIVSLIAEAALLFVAALTGFLGGPRVLSNMAIDSWMPHRFSQLSDRLVTKDGILMMGLAALAALIYTKGDIGTLVVMYSINVFITFTLTELGMFRYWTRERQHNPKWKPPLAIHSIGLVMCLCILIITTYEKFAQGGWITLVVTTILVLISFAIHKHYQTVKKGLRSLDDILTDVPAPAGVENVEPLNPNEPTAVILVKSFSGFGIHEVLSIHRLFPRTFKNFIFVSAAIVDSGSFKGADEVHALQEQIEHDLERYVQWARANGMRADYRMGIGTEAVDTTQQVCRKVAEEFPRAIFFLGKLIFKEEKWYYRLLHNETPNAIQRRLQFDGLQAIVLPIRVLDAA